MGEEHPEPAPETLSAGERVLLIDGRRRRRLITLTPGDVQHLHTGTLPHDQIIGQVEGSTVRTSLGAALVVLRPTLSEYVLKMRRGAQVIYPKDLGPILMLADIRPGDRVFESGVGSGALTMALLRAVGPTGHVLGYERREDFAARARHNVEEYFAGAALPPPAQGAARALPLTIEIRDSYEGIDVVNLDKVVLDLPEPWQLVKHAQDALRPGGIFLSYLPTIGQVARLCDELEGSRFAMVETLEVLHRTWHVKAPSVRPDHRMVAHTGFLTHARLLAPSD
ncbi:MAG: tRNA (adenine-N1)-methyltransferase [Actinobacteria bacterium]|nr:tRNA (adenine-N1)-methyltransferase [Actinomycetota bacterium]